MRKAFLAMMLFLLVGFTVNAQTIKRQVVGTGGFIGKAIGNDNTIYGIFGQPVTGIRNAQQNKTYWGFWTWDSTFIKGTSIEEDIANKGVGNYPNPVSNFTTFKFDLKEVSYVTLNVYNSIGALVATIIKDELLPAGQNSIDWNTVKGVSNGGTLNIGSYMYEVLVVPTVATSSNTRAFRNILMISK
jgi:hypothetical protein